MPLERHANRTLLRCGDCGAAYLDVRAPHDLTSPVRHAEGEGWVLAQIDGVLDWKCPRCVAKPEQPKTEVLVVDGGGKETKWGKRKKEPWKPPDKIPSRRATRRTQ